MNKTAHSIYLATLTLIVIAVTIYLFYYGASYYNTSMEERFYHADHAVLKPSGIYGHGLGIIGTLLILIGVFGYMARKRYRILSRIGVLKHWLEFHIFLCTLGPIMILFHTSFKFGGIVSISFWSMVAVVASGVIGRFIYLQIPRTIQGRELSIAEIGEMQEDISYRVREEAGEHSEDVLQAWHDVIQERKNQGNPGFFKTYIRDYQLKSRFAGQLKAWNISTRNNRIITGLIATELGIQRKIERLMLMQKLFRYWHIAHLPFALIMLIIMVIHVGVTLAFGYKWIF
ncbi:MAG TPA: hypothetical protein PLQ57_04575 [Saprospiraceae bacterium]|nr:hypothetical protein [Saprospiraceae bacterium]HRG20277.1 hypothetical protein [Saprospiraceae bacterium]HRG65197.1 hypothetical protein [Saprospiraceae bacterium]